ncbi:RHS repeat-associated core domain-containing protein [Enterobacter ludwigii]
MFDKSRKTAAGTTRFIRHGHACLGVAGPAGLTLTAGDGNDSLLWSRNAGQGSGKTRAWSPYGKGETTDGLPGFNGERPDPVSGSYHLGNGYRAYNPVLRRFNCPDSLSPFGAGGINPYTYCLGDPVNRTDPTGHISWQGILGIVTGAIGLGLSLFTAGASIAAAGSISVALSSASRLGLTIGLIGVAADVTSIASGATEDVNPEASSVLGWVSMATGIAGMGIGLAQLPKGIKAYRQSKTVGADINGIPATRRETYRQTQNVTAWQSEITPVPRNINQQDLHEVVNLNARYNTASYNPRPVRSAAPTSSRTLHEQHVSRSHYSEHQRNTPRAGQQKTILTQEQNQRVKEIMEKEWRQYEIDSARGDALASYRSREAIENEVLGLTQSYNIINKSSRRYSAMEG